MSRKIIALFLALVCLSGGALFAQAATPQSTAADRALDYIRTLQNTDGGFPAKTGSDSDAGTTIDVILAFVDAGVNPHGVKNGSNSPLDYLAAQAVAYTTGAADTVAGHAAKLVIGLEAAKEDPRDFAGDDWVAKMQSYYDSATHCYGSQVIDQALYILARASLGLSPQSGTAAYLESKQLPDGCWEFTDGFGCDTNSTAMAVQALVVAGVGPSDASIQAALAYFKAAQNADGGFPYLIPSPSDAQSTAWVLQGLVAAGENVDAGGPWEKPGGHTPMHSLLNFQNASTGAFAYMYAGTDNAYASYQAVPALLLQPLLLPPNEEAQPTNTPRATKTPTSTAAATATVATTPTTPPMVATVPSATPVAQVLPAATGPSSLPRALASSGQGGSDGQRMPALAVLLGVVAGGCTVFGLLARRRHGSTE